MKRTAILLLLAGCASRAPLPITPPGARPQWVKAEVVQRSETGSGAQGLTRPKTTTAAVPAVQTSGTQPTPVDPTTIYPPDGVTASNFIWLVYSTTSLSFPYWEYEPVLLVFNADGSVTREVFMRGRKPLFFKGVGVPR